jgi:hypothetical protein
MYVRRAESGRNLPQAAFKGEAGRCVLVGDPGESSGKANEPSEFLCLHCGIWGFACDTDQGPRAPIWRQGWSGCVGQVGTMLTRSDSRLRRGQLLGGNQGS